MKTIRRAQGGSKERTVRVSAIHIPDLWKLVQEHKHYQRASEKAQILECWHLTHDLLRAVKETP